MSASLVGSEMCIRDSSALTAREPPEASPDSDFLAHNGAQGLAGGARWRSCLLYTSDAADDM
eukprot:481730-Alexandrium_andersonii.AAC.1